MSAIAVPVAVLALLAACGALVYLRRVRRTQGELQRTIHEHALALDRRCDVLQEQLDRLALGQRVDHLGRLVAAAERRGLFGADVAARLEDEVLELRRECDAGADGRATGEER